MNTTEHLLQKLQEECNEVAKEASKCNLFGLDDVNAVQVKTDPNWPCNRKILAMEIDDLEGTIKLLRKLDILPPPNPARQDAKAEKIWTWMKYANKKGTLINDNRGGQI